MDDFLSNQTGRNGNSTASPVLNLHSAGLISCALTLFLNTASCNHQSLCLRLVLYAMAVGGTAVIDVGGLELQTRNNADLLTQLAG